MEGKGLWDKKDIERRKWGTYKGGKGVNEEYGKRPFPCPR
jgi:hypothetical protein